MRFQSFRTSGTTGSPKDFTLSEPVMETRVERLAWTKGAEFKSLKSIVWLNAMHSAGHAKVRSWCDHHGVTMHYHLREADGIIASPYMLHRAAKYDLRFGYILSGGAPLSGPVCRTIRERILAPGGAMYSTYGLSECGTVAIATAEQVEAIPGCLGRVFDDVTAEIVDGGHLRVRTPTMSDDMMRDGWVYTGDRAEFIDGLLVWRGRMR